MWLTRVRSYEGTNINWAAHFCWHTHGQQNNSPYPYQSPYQLVIPIDSHTRTVEISLTFLTIFMKLALSMLLASVPSALVRPKVPGNGRSIKFTIGAGEKERTDTHPHTHLQQCLKMYFRVSCVSMPSGIG